MALWVWAGSVAAAGLCLATFFAEDKGPAGVNKVERCKPEPMKPLPKLPGNKRLKLNENMMNFLQFCSNYVSICFHFQFATLQKGGAGGMRVLQRPRRVLAAAHPVGHALRAPVLASVRTEGVGVQDIRWTRNE
jgi:hypothetical protein